MPTWFRRGRGLARRERVSSHNLPALHHESHITQLFDILHRIALNGDKIGEKPRGDASKVGVPMQYVRVHTRCRAKGSNRRHPVLYHQFEFERIGAVREHTHVAAIAYRNT